MDNPSMDLSPPIQMDILLNSWDKFVAVFADFPGSLNRNYIAMQLRRRKANISTVTLLDSKGTCPLLEFLRSYNCSSKVLRLLFLNGVDVNANNAQRHSALVTALHHHSNKTCVIKVMLQAGADVDTLRFYRNCALCVALKQSACPNVIKMLLRAGCSPNCGEELTPLFHATKYQNPKCRQEILKVLIDSGAELRARYGSRSILCYALTSIESRQDVDLLIGLGIPTDACNVHGSPILCALDFGGVLTADIAESLLGPFENPMPGHDHLYTLNRSITHPIRFSEPHIPLRLALEREESRIEGQYGTLLHAVTYNAHCSPELVELLVRRGVPVGKQSSEGETPVHVALRMEKPVLSVLRALLRLGCPVEAKDWDGRTALHLAILLELDIKVLKVLLDAGASVIQQNGGMSALEKALNHHSERSVSERTEEAIVRELPFILGRRRNWLYFIDTMPDFQEERLRIGAEYIILLFLYSFLENPALDINCTSLIFHASVMDFEVLMKFFCRCRRELSKMAKMKVGVGYTLFDFISRNLLLQSNVNHYLSENNFDFDKLLRILKNTKFTKYLDMILDRVPRKVMEKKLDQLRVCAVRYRPHLQVIILNYQCVSEIAKYLSNIDLMNMILAFHNCPPKRSSSTRKAENKKQRIK